MASVNSVNTFTDDRYMAILYDSAMRYINPHCVFGCKMPIRANFVELFFGF